MYNPNMQQLPFSISHQQHQFGNYNFVPNFDHNFMAMYQSYSGIVQPLAKFMMDEIQGKAQQSPLRMFLFNQMATNGFANNDFVSMVMAGIEYFAYLSRRQNIVPTPQAVMNVAQEMTTFMTAANYRVYPGLQQYEDFNKVQGVLRNYDAITEDIRRERSAGQYPGIQGNWQGGGGGGMGNMMNGMANMSPMGGINTTPFNQMGGGSNIGLSRSYGNAQQATTPTGIFTANSHVNDLSVDKGSHNMGRSFSSEHSFNPASVEKEIVTTLDQTVVDLEEANRRWKPSVGAFYRPAYEPSHQKLVATKSGDRYSYRVVDIGESEMDPERHRTALFGKPNTLVTEKLAASPDNTTKLAEAVSDARTAITGIDCTLDTFTRIALDELPTELGYDSVWVSGIVERIKRTRDRKDPSPINITQWDSNVVKPIVIDGEPALEFIRSLADMDSQRLITALKVATKKNVLSAALIATIDERMTAAVNEAVRTNMSISGLSIDSFVDDWHDLINIITNKYGEAIAARLVANDEKLIKTTLKLISDDLAHSLTMGIYETPDDETYPISYFSEHVSFTMLEFFSSELDIDFVKNTSALLSKLHTRVWYSLAEQIFREYANCTKHLIRTSDDKILEIKRGWLADDAYIISVVK